MYPYPSIEAAKQMIKPDDPDHVEYLMRMKEHKLKTDEIGMARYNRFVGVLKKLGYLDHQKIDTTKLDHMEKLILDEIRKVDYDLDYWTTGTVMGHLHKHVRVGLYPVEYFPPDLGVEIMKIVDSPLANGDILSENLTRDAIVHRLPDSFNYQFPVHHAVLSFMLHSQERELLRRRLRAQALNDYHLCPSFDSEDTEVSPYRREYYLDKNKRDESRDDKYRLYLKAIEYLGGDKNIADITPEALYVAIDDPYWTLDKVGQELYLHKLGGYPRWTHEHHNRMLELINQLENDCKEVNAQNIYQLMHPDGKIPPMNFNGVLHHLEIYQEIKEFDPFDPFCLPQKPVETISSYKWSPRDVLEVASELC